MLYQIIPTSDKIGTIPARNLYDAIGMKHCLKSKLNMDSTITDSDGWIISEKEQSEVIFEHFCQ
jgi:hypothetical protein